MLTNKPELINFLKKLFDTNEEFVKNHDKKFFAKFSKAQTPKLTILKCSDSRVQMESFDKTPQNEIFAIRNIGNQIVTSEGSVDFGVTVLNTPFLLIIGHSGCGAVEACVNKTILDSDAINKEINNLKITTTNIKDAVIENIHYQVDMAVKKYQDRINNNDLTVIGAIYDFKNDYGLGAGKVILTNINGEQNSKKLKEQYSKDIENILYNE